MRESEDEYAKIAKKGGWQYSDGTKYYGGFDVKGVRQGLGSIRLNDGTTYHGSFQDGLPNGLGITLFSDGARYEGEMMDGWFHGVGVFWKSDGMRFEGEFRGGRAWGKGMLTFSDETQGFPKHEGHFQDCRFLRREKCPEIVSKAQKAALIARSQHQHQILTN